MSITFNQLHSCAVAAAAPNFSAVPSALGYLYQVRYALHLLLDADPDALVTLEKLDDVAFEKDGSPHDLLQIKHHIDKTASLTDASSDLWKTIRVWSEGIRANRPEFLAGHFLLVTTAIAPGASAAEALRPGEIRNIDNALTILRQVADSSQNETNKAAYVSFKKLDVDQQRALFARVYVLDLAPNIAEIGERIRKQVRVAAPEKNLESFCERLEGWWLRRVINMWTASAADLPGTSRRELQAFLDDLRQQFHRENLPADFAEKTAVPEKDLPEDNSLFVAQLRTIKVGSERIRDAKSDFFRAFEQRSKWVREDLVWEGEIEEYEDRLLAEWRNLFYAFKEDCEEDPEESVIHRARALYNAIIDTPRHIPIRPNFPHPYVMRGSYHMLANVPRLCWHPHWEQRLIQDVKEELHA